MRNAARDAATQDGRDNTAAVDPGFPTFPTTLMELGRLQSLAQAAGLDSVDEDAPFWNGREMSIGSGPTSSMTAEASTTTVPEPDIQPAASHAPRITAPGGNVFPPMPGERRLSRIARLRTFAAEHYPRISRRGRQMSNNTTEARTLPRASVNDTAFVNGAAGLDRIPVNNNLSLNSAIMVNGPPPVNSTASVNNTANVNSDHINDYYATTRVNSNTQTATGNSIHANPNVYAHGPIRSAFAYRRASANARASANRTMPSASTAPPTSSAARDSSTTNGRAPDAIIGHVTGTGRVSALGRVFGPEGGTRGGAIPVFGPMPAAGGAPVVGTMPEIGRVAYVTVQAPDDRVSLPGQT